jgi:siroheme synthase (precorrin-2 oxidase/ferrochelatase)
VTASFGNGSRYANPVIARIDETLSPGVNQVVSQPTNIGNDTIETALQQFRDRMTDGRSILSDFTAVQRLRGDLSDAVQSSVQSNRGMEIGHVHFAVFSAKSIGQ